MFSLYSYIKVTVNNEIIFSQGCFYTGLYQTHNLTHPWVTKHR